MKRWHAMALGAIGLWLFLGAVALLIWGMVSLGKVSFLVMVVLFITWCGASVGADIWKEETGEVYGPGDDGS